MGATNSSPSQPRVPISANVDTSGFGSGSFMGDNVREWEAERRSEAVIGADCGCGERQNEIVEAPVARPPYMASSVEEWEKNTKS